MFLQEEYNHCSTTTPSGNSCFDQTQKMKALPFVMQIDRAANYFPEMIMLNQLLRVLLHQEKYPISKLFITC